MLGPLLGGMLNITEVNSDRNLKQLVLLLGCPLDCNSVSNALKGGLWDQFVD